MRCPDCNKFVSLELGEPEVTSDPEVEETDKGKGIVRLTISVPKVCAECGTEMQTKEIEIETEVDLTGFEDTV
jgi:hypothetical protein